MMRTGHMVVGWDIGGVNTKAAGVVDGQIVAVRERAFELQRAPEALASLLRDMVADIGATADADHAVTMTAELSQMFRTKREGVGFVLDAVAAAFPSAAVHVFTVDGLFVTAAEARRRHLKVAAANWAATAAIVARHHRDAVLVDIGTTSTDIIPIANGQVVASGTTDPERLASGELVYSGAVRTAAEAVASRVPLHGAEARVSAEAFALVGDAHVWRGDLAAADYAAPTPDGRPVTREFAGERLARVVCADREMLDDEAITGIADALAEAQVGTVADAIGSVAARHPHSSSEARPIAVVTGLGAFIARRAAERAGLRVTALAAQLGGAAARCAPASAVALLLSDRLTRVDLVVKLGGGVFTQRTHFDVVLSAVAAAARECRLVVVPGGGPFADAVRRADDAVELSDDAAHWMAVLAMDQYAHLLASRMANAVIATGARDVAAALRRGQVPVLAPYRWLRECDPLPHTWSVTSDSIAAWIAAALEAPRLLLIKPAGARGGSLVDDHFGAVLSAAVEAAVVAADDLGQLQSIFERSSAASMRFSATPR